MGDRAAKNELFDAFADVARALGSGRRAELVDVLAQGERHVDELAAEIGQSVANTSFHLRALASAGLVRTRSEGTRVFYRLASTRVSDLWSAVRDVAAAHRADLDDLASAYLGDRTELESISREQLEERLRAGDVVLVDVRPPAEYHAGHIAGARSIPIDDFAAALDDLPADQEIVAYCRGPYCAYADEAVRLAGGHGRRARRLTDGYPEWARAGLPRGRSDRPGRRR